MFLFLSANFFDFSYCSLFKGLKAFSISSSAIDNLKNSKRLNGIYILVGDGPQSDELEKLIEEKKLGDIVIYFKQNRKRDFKIWNFMGKKRIQTEIYTF